MKCVETELCAYSPESVKTGAGAGVTRIELCAGPFEGGTTPSAAAIETAVRIARETGLRTDRRPMISVMIRPRGGDFLYSADEFAQMRRDVEFARECGADCVVVGILTPDGAIDVARTGELVKLARPLQTTFHRAIDVAAGPVTARLEEVIAAGCDRVLTSGGRETAIEGVENIAAMVRAAGGRIAVMAGSGVNPENAREIAIKTGVDALHFSAKATRDSEMKFRSGAVSFAPTGCSDFDVAFADPGFVGKMVGLAAGTENDMVARQAKIRAAAAGQIAQRRKFNR